MDELPDALFIIDPKKEYIAVKRRTSWKSRSSPITDTNCDPELSTT